jgi:uncharacterized membrane protein
MSKTFSTERICAFTDGVYAIVITLLVLELKAPEVPGITDEQLLVDLLKQSTSFIAYFISFFVVGLLWFRHHGIFKALEKSNNVVIFLNFIHLLFVSLIPYTSSLAGRYEQDQLAVLMFFGNIALSGVTVSLLKQYVLPKREWQKKELFEQLNREEWKHRFTMSVGPVVAILVSFYDAQVALWVFLVLIPPLALITWR